MMSWYEMTWRRIPRNSAYASTLIAADGPERGTNIVGRAAEYAHKGDTIARRRSGEICGQTERVDSKGRLQVRYRRTHDPDLPDRILIPAAPGEAWILDTTTDERLGPMLIADAIAAAR